MHNKLTLFKMQNCMKQTRPSKLHTKTVFVYILVF